MRSAFATQYAALVAALPSCPACRRDLLTRCLHASFVLYCGCGHRIRPADLATRPSPQGRDALAVLLAACERQLHAVTQGAADGSAPAPAAGSEGLQRLLQHLEAQILLLRAMGVCAPGTLDPAPRDCAFA